MRWREADIPAQKGRLAFVTGTGGLGFEAARALAMSGGDVVIAGRSAAKGAQAVARIRAAAPRATIRFESLDLASLSSIQACVERLNSAGKPLAILINNAGVMSVPRRRETVDGFELQFGTNYLGHFALTLQLLPLLLQAEQPRVVSVSSLYHRQGVIDFDDLQGRAYKPGKAYGQSKLALLMFALELDRRARAAGLSLMSNAAHPGFARTDLISNGPGTQNLTYVLSRVLASVASHSAAQGALPLLYGATAPEALGGAYYGPSGLYELKGPPRPAFIAPRARDEAVARRLWAESERLTHMKPPTLFVR